MEQVIKSVSQIKWVHNLQSIITVASVWNTGESGDINKLLTIYQSVHITYFIRYDPVLPPPLNSMFIKVQKSLQNWKKDWTRSLKWLLVPRQNWKSDGKTAELLVGWTNCCDMYYEPQSKTTKWFRFLPK